MLLPPLALFVAWIERDRILSYRATRDGHGLLLTGIACATFVLGKLASEFSGGSIVRITLPEGNAREGLSFASSVIPRMERCLGHQ